MFNTSSIPVTAIETTFIITMPFPPGPLSHSKTAPSKFLSEVYCQHWAGAVMFVCEMTTGIEEEVWRQKRAGAPCFNYNVSLLVPRNGPPPVVLKHYHPLPLPVVQMSKTESLPKGKGEQEVVAGPQSSLAPTHPPPDSSMKKIHTKINSQHCYSIVSSPFL